MQLLTKRTIHRSGSQSQNWNSLLKRSEAPARAVVEVHLAEVVAVPEYQTQQQTANVTRSGQPGQKLQPNTRLGQCKCDAH